jgi:hypothetical protein
VGITIYPLREHFRVMLLKPFEEKKNILLRRLHGMAGRK